MPIFVSRFSPERSLVGNFLSPRTPAREVRESPETDRRATSTGNGTNTAQRAVRSAENVSAPDSARSTPEKASSNQDATSQNIGADSLTLLDQLRLRRNATNLIAEFRDNVGSAEPIQDPPPSASKTAGTGAGPLADRLTALIQDLASNGSDGVGPSEASPDVIETLSAENQQANETAATERLEGLINALQTSDTTVAAEVSSLSSNPSAVASVVEPREEQERTLRQDVQSIATGLRQDAAIESQRTAAQTAQTANAAANRGQRQEARANQREIQSLQTERRQSQQDVQRTDQAIRQLQTRTNRINTSSPQPNAGNALDLLAE
jgi:hypothetical protein